MTLDNEFEQHKKLADIVFGCYSMEQKTVAMQKIQQQSPVFRQLYQTLSTKEKAEIYKLLMNGEMPLLNLSDFADIKGLAFCTDFGGYACPSAYMSPRELYDISEIEKVPLAWDVYHAQERDGYRRDSTYDLFFSDQQYRNTFLVAGLDYLDVSSQAIWANNAFDATTHANDYQIVFSRSNNAASHIAAYMYKQQHPKVTWYARLGDPIWLSSDNEMLHLDQQVDCLTKYSVNYYESIELAIYDSADKVIFTNENMRNVMQRYCANQTLLKKLKNKTIVLKHRPLDQKYCTIFHSNYVLDSRRINIAYFGVGFYDKQPLKGLFSLLNNREVNLHLFVPKFPTERVGDRMKSINDIVLPTGYDEQRVTIHDAVDCLEMLNICKNMDYLYVEDRCFTGLENPYLPSKIADYISSGTTIIAKVQKDSALSKMGSERLLVTTEVTPEFARCLTKQR